MKIGEIFKFLDIYNKKLPKSSPKRLTCKNDKIVDEDEMSVSMLNPSASADNLSSADTFATGDFRIPTIMGGIQRRNRRKK